MALSDETVCAPNLRLAGQVHSHALRLSNSGEKFVTRIKNVCVRSKSSMRLNGPSSLLLRTHHLALAAFNAGCGPVWASNSIRCRPHLNLIPE